ncbi:MAG TPA: MlaD family protein [Acidimicrobiales bacterium]|nr:MlaD family protein [Acidimicrobiales bacterium]
MRSTLIKLTAFVTLCVVIAVALVFSIGNVQSLRIGPVQLLDDSYRLTATFDDVTGLLINDNVKVAGVKVGKVTGIQVVDGKARVTMRVKHQLKLPVDTEAAIRWRNLLGQRYLYLYPGTASTALQPGEAIKHTTSVVDLGELLNRLGPIVAAIDPNKVNDFLDTVVAALNGNEAKVGESLDALAKIAATLGERDEAIGRLVSNIDVVSAAVADRDREIRQVLDNLVLITKAFDDNVDVLDKASVELADYNGHLADILSHNRTQIDGILTNLTTVVNTVGDKLPTVEHIVAGLDDGVLRLANVSQYGEWLDQSIVCLRVGYPALASTPCLDQPSNNMNGIAGSQASVLKGAAGIRSILSLAVSR